MTTPYQPNLAPVDSAKAAETIMDLQTTLATLGITSYNYRLGSDTDPHPNVDGASAQRSVGHTLERDY